MIPTSANGLGDGLCGRNETDEHLFASLSGYMGIIDGRISHMTYSLS